MRHFIRIVETAGSLAPTAANLATAKAFVLRKWKERAAERGNSEPSDLAGACKFAAVFAKALFGGTIRANDFHTWVENGGSVIDLCDDASDVAQIKRGQMPPEMAAYAEMWSIELPKDLYTSDRAFERSADFKQSLASIEPRVKRWVAEFHN